MSRARRAAAAAALMAVAALAPAAAGAPCSDRARPDPRVPTWQQVNHAALGAREASDEQIDRYLQAVDARSARVRTEVAGTSAGGRPIRFAIVGTPGRLRRLPAYAAGARSIRDGGTVPAGFARSAPAFVWIAGTVHGNEPSGGDADMQLLYDLAAGRTCAVQRMLRGTITFVLPVQNPDGRAAGTHVSGRHFDLNRDWFAMTQPEARARIAALSKYPPVAFADQHEEAGQGFFFPPNADPVHHEISAAALRAIDGVVAPRLRRAFKKARFAYTNYATYDLFYMGYGDTVPATLYGAAGMTFEKGAESPYRTKVAEHLLAARTTVAAVAADRKGLLARWAAQWAQARAQGRAGTLQPNRIVQPGNVVRFPVPNRRIYGYAFRGDVHAADAAALARRLAAQGVHVLRLRSPLSVSGFRAYGSPLSQAATLPAGSYVVSSAQAAKHWVEAILGEDPYVAFPYFYDVCSWSNPMLMGLSGGALTSRVSVPSGSADAVAADERPAEPPAGAAHFTWPGGSERAVELAFSLLRDKVPVQRTPDGGFAASGDAVAPAATRAGVALAAADALPEGATDLALPRVAILDGPASDDSTADLSGGWARWLLDERYGLGAKRLSIEEIVTGGLSGFDALVVPDGGTPRASAPALAALQAWVHDGGRLIGWRGRGIALARAAGLTAVTTRPVPASFAVPGAQLRVTIDPSDPVAYGEEVRGFAFDSADPIVDANGARVVASYPSGGGFFVSGYTSGADVLQGTAAATDEVSGAGRVVLFAFDPVFRGYTDGGERLVGNALLAPAPPPVATAPSVAPGGAARRGAAGASGPAPSVAAPLGPSRPAPAPAPRAVDPSVLATAPSPSRDAVVVVAAEDEAALLAAARRAGLRGGFTLARDLTTVSLRVPNPRGLAPDRRPWTLRLPGALRAAGVTPVLAAF